MFLVILGYYEVLNTWKKEETQRNVYLVCVIGHAKFWYVQ